jgi:hypothetical protein
MEKDGISFSGIQQKVSIFLSTISCATENNYWTWTYIHYRKKGAPLKAAIAAHATNGECDLLIKIYVSENENKTHFALKEFENLKYFYDILPLHQKSTLPEPIQGSDEILATEWVDSSSMKLRLAWARFLPTARHSCLTHAAELLKLIHEVSPQHAQRVDWHSYIDTAQCSGSSDLSWNQNLNRFVDTLKSTEDDPAPYCRLHYDFSPENILISKHRKSIIDFASDKNGPIYQDICHMIMYFSIYCNGIFCSTTETLIEDLNVVFSTYSGKPNTPPNEPLMLMLWMTLLIRWGRHDSKAKDPKRATYLRALDWYFARQIKACCLRLDEILTSDRGTQT